MAKRKAEIAKEVEEKEKRITNPKGEKFKFTQETRELFLDTLVDNNFNIPLACKSVGITQAVFYRRLNTDKEFEADYKSLIRPIYTSITNRFLTGINDTNHNIALKYLALIPERMRGKILGETLEEVSDSSKPHISL